LHRNRFCQPLSQRPLKKPRRVARAKVVVVAMVSVAASVRSVVSAMPRVVVIAKASEAKRVKAAQVVVAPHVKIAQRVPRVVQTRREPMKVPARAAVVVVAEVVNATASAHRSIAKPLPLKHSPWP